MKRKLTALSAAFLCLCLLTACGSEPPKESEPAGLPEVSVPDEGQSAEPRTSASPAPTQARTTARVRFSMSASPCWVWTMRPLKTRSGAARRTSPPTVRRSSAASTAPSFSVRKLSPARYTTRMARSVPSTSPAPKPAPTPNGSPNSTANPMRTARGNPQSPAAPGRSGRLSAGR